MQEGARAGRGIVGDGEAVRAGSSGQKRELQIADVNFPAEA